MPLTPCLPSLHAPHPLPPLPPCPSTPFLPFLPCLPGAFPYAKLVLRNFLSHYLRGRTGLVFYRGLELAQLARALTLIAQYARFTGDGDLPLAHFDKIQGIVDLLRKRRKRALALSPADAAFGTPVGNDEADLFRMTVLPSHPRTELPFFSIAAEMWRGLVDLGSVWLEIGASAGRDDVTAAGKSMVEVEAPALLSDLLRSLNRSVVSTGDPAAPRCWPYVAGAGACDSVPGAASDRDSEPWRTYPEMMWAAAVPTGIVNDVLAYNQHHSKMMRVGLPSGSGSSCCGNQLQTFTSHGWGYGLLRNDLPRELTLALFASSAHAQTRGTWTAPEEADITGSGMPYCPPSQLAMPLFLKWAYVFDHPDDNSIWLGRGAPRSLTFGNISVYNVPTRHGRIGYQLRCTAAGTTCSANISIPSAWALQDARGMGARGMGSHGTVGNALAWQAPTGGLYLRVRPQALALVGATLGGVTPLTVDSKRHCVWFDHALLVRNGSSLEDVRLSFNRA